ncbi:hypothetical protein [endosymbiont GvMRE of Glomus versiforme]|uniref:hypothetical protein n=1 Tax=endosymbiont GvMRE of Glomus versiforme TaxID=2039283 RepID=UPI000EEB9508|nr:hypothetical protein [endosymbiont GvMRE of Glomus versiforme]RHZ35505.1 hypothetical protein GvMRE_IIg233 [endosymbiont GvMRE of Glomus versiforme]
MRKKLKKFVLVGLIVAILVIVAFFIGEKFTKNPNTLEIKIEELQNKLQEAENKLTNETNSINRQKLQAKIDQLTRQLTNLKKGNDLLPNKNHHQLTVKYNTKVGGKREYIDVNDHKKRILIDHKNKIFSLSATSDLIIKDNQYNFSFHEEDATKGPGNNNWVFEADNDKFTLTPKYSPPSQNPTPNEKIEVEVKLDGISVYKWNYWGFDDKSDWNSRNPNMQRRFCIAKNHPFFKGKKMERQNCPPFKLSFQKKNISGTNKWGNNLDEYYFDENNNDFTLTPLANWPDETNPNNSPPPIDNQEKVELEYSIFSIEGTISLDSKVAGIGFGLPSEYYYLFKQTSDQNLPDLYFCTEHLVFGKNTRWMVNLCKIKLLKEDLVNGKNVFEIDDYVEFLHK